MTAANPGACKHDTRVAKRQAMMIAREVRNLLIRACSDADFTRACEDLCNAADPWDEIPNCCEEIFHDVTCVAPLGELIIPPLLPPLPPPPPSGGGFVGGVTLIGSSVSGIDITSRTSGSVIDIGSPVIVSSPPPVVISPSGSLNPLVRATGGSVTAGGGLIATFPQATARVVDFLEGDPDQ
jgi:hypothetical protein